MKHLGVLLFAFVAFVSNAQDSSVQGKINALKKKLEKRSVGDTIKLPGDSLKIKIAGLDSTRSNNPLQKIQSDSLPKVNPSGLSEKISGKQDSIKNRITEPVNSVAANANKQVSNLQNKIQGNADSLNQKLNNRVNGLKSKIENKTSQEGGKNINLPYTENKLPGISQPDLGELNKALPNTDVKIPAVNMPGLQATAPELGKLPNATGQTLPTKNGLSIPSVALPQIDGKIPELKADVPGVDKLNTGIPEIKTELPTLIDSTGKPDFSVLEKIPGSEKVQKVTNKIEEASGLKDEAGKYKEQIAELKETKIEDIDTKRLEEEATKIAEVKEVDAQTQKLRALQAQQAVLLQRYSDKKLIQEELKRKTANVVNDQMGKFAPAIKNAQSDMSKTKKVYANSTLVPDSTKRRKRENVMAGKPFKKRIVPGITFQTYSGNDEVLMDLSPQVGYRLTGWLTAGLGAVYRIGLGKANPSFIAGKNTYGYRLHADYTLVRGIFLHGDFESLQVGQTQTGINEFSEMSVKGSYFGIGKHYSISRNIKGSLLALYRVNYSGSTGQSKFTIRVGFDYVFKKKRKLIG